MCVIKIACLFFTTPLSMSLLWFLIIGVLAGWIAGELYKGHGFGLVGNLVVGIVGAVVGGFLFDLLNVGPGYGLVGSLVTAVVGAVVLLFLLNAFRRA